MRITAKIDYAVRACAELASRYTELPDGSARYTKAEEISDAQGVSTGFVLGILNELKQAGLVESRRGADGGYRLAVSPDRIVIADVVRVIDGPLANVAGRNVEDVSYDGAATSVRDVWVALRAAMRTVLDEVTLSDVVAGALGDDVTALIADEEAWRTRPNGRRTRIGRIGDATD